MTPLQVRVLGHLLQNQGLALNAKLDAAIQTYEELIEDFGTNDIIDYIALAKSHGLSLTEAALIQLVNDYPSLFNGLVSVEVSSSNETGDIVFDSDIVKYKEFQKSSFETLDSVTNFSVYLRNWAEKKLLGDGDISKYTQLFVLADSTRQTLNATINTANNSENFMSMTFGGMTNLMTGNFSAISTNLSLLAQDCKNLGNLIDLQNIQYLGHPLALLKKLSDIANGDLPIIGNRLVNAGVDAKILDFPDINDNKYLITASRICYEQMKTIQGVELANIMKLFDIAITAVSGNREIFAVRAETMADLLDVKKIFPLSALTLTTSVDSQTIGIYDSNRVPNPNLLKSVLLDQILPSDISRPNQALARSFLQVKNIQTQNLSSIANAIGSLEATDGIAAVSNFNKPVSSALVSEIVNKFTRSSTNFIKSTGVKNTFTLTDFIGSPGGTIHSDQLAKINSVLPTAITDLLKSQWSSIKNSINAQSSIPGPSDPPLPSDFDIVELIQNFRLQIQSSSKLTGIGSSLELMQQQIKREKINLATAAGTVAFPILTSDNKSSVSSFAAQLGEYGKNNDLYNAAYCIEQLIESSEAGQTIIAAMREGRNSQMLQNLNIDLDNTISNTQQ